MAAVGWSWWWLPPLGRVHALHFTPASPGPLYSGSLLAQPGLWALDFGEVKTGDRSEAALLYTESFITGLSLPSMLPVIAQSPPEPSRSHTTSALWKDSCTLPGFSPDLQWEVLHEALRDELRQAAGEGVLSLAGGPLFCASHTSVGGEWWGKQRIHVLPVEGAA